MPDEKDAPRPEEELVAHAPRPEEGLVGHAPRPEEGLVGLAEKGIDVAPEASVDSNAPSAAVVPSEATPAPSNEGGDGGQISTSSDDNP